MNILVKTENWFHMRRHGYPSRSAIEFILKDMAAKRELSSRLKARKYSIAHVYTFNSKEIEEIADQFLVTRERVRQILRHIYFQYVGERNENASA
jgi:DNA-directed RNA polymerase sigma subunit (sigma70/sigma32)